MIVTILCLDGSVADADLGAWVAALGKQLAQHFNPAWGTSARVVAGTKGADVTGPVLYVQHGIDVQGALGYHDEHANGQPYAIVSTDVCAQAKVSVSSCISHELLEMVGNVDVDLYVPGPGPHGHEVWWWHEMCDACQGDSYQIDGVEVSNFVLPAYFKPGKPGATNYLGLLLPALGLRPGGYMGYVGPGGVSHQVTADARAEEILAAKGALGPHTRRGKRRDVVLGVGG